MVPPRNLSTTTIRAFVIGSSESASITLPQKTGDSGRRCGIGNNTQAWTVMHTKRTHKIRSFMSRRTPAAVHSASHTVSSCWFRKWLGVIVQPRTLALCGMIRWFCSV